MKLLVVVANVCMGLLNLAMGIGHGYLISYVCAAISLGFAAITVLWSSWHVLMNMGDGAIPKRE